MWRWVRRYEEHGYDWRGGDRRVRRSSPKRVPWATVEQVLGLYRDKYKVFNMIHFVEKLQREEGIELN